MDYYGAYPVLGDLGFGANASVYLSQDKKGREVVLKVSKPTSLAQHEVQMLRRFAGSGFNHVLQCYDTFEDGSWMVLVLERFAGTILTRKVSPWFFLNCMLHTLRGLCEMDARGVVHDDLKPENILVREGDTGKSYRCAIADLGGARMKGEQPKGFTLPYAAPELVAGKPSDVTALYSWALCMEKLATGVVGAVRSGGSIGDRNPFLGLAFDGLLRRCQDPSPHHRPAPYQVLHEVESLARMVKRSVCPEHGCPVIPSAKCYMCG